MQHTLMDLTQITQVQIWKTTTFYMTTVFSQNNQPEKNSQISDTYGSPSPGRTYGRSEIASK